MSPHGAIGDGWAERTPTGESLGFLVEAWSIQVARIFTEATGPKPSDYWGADDLIGALYVRERLETGLEASSRLTPLPAVVHVADHLYRSICEPDALGGVQKWQPDAPTGHWWWHVIPRSGPIREEIDAFVHG